MPCPESDDKQLSVGYVSSCTVTYRYHILDDFSTQVKLMEKTKEPLKSYGTRKKCRDSNQHHCYSYYNIIMYFERDDLNMLPLNPVDLDLVHLAKSDHQLPSDLRPVQVTDDGAESG